MTLIGKVKAIILRLILRSLFFVNPLMSFRFYIKFKKNISYREQSVIKMKNPLLGIFIEPSGFHHFYVDACQEMDIPFILIDLMQTDWLIQVEKSECKGFLAWPSASLTIWRNLYDERIIIIEEELKRTVFPSFKETWMWESKRRMHYWLEANKVKHPKGWVFYEYDEAKSFVEKAYYPMVFKTNHGDSSRGVRIVRTKKQAMRLTKKSFGRGSNYSTNYPLDKEWGNILLQEYIPEATEWRLIRVGDSYFGYQKVRIGDFASGHGEARYCAVPTELLDYIRDITEKHNFRSMSFDILQSSSNEFFIIELQSLFGDTKSGRKCIVNGKLGRYIFKEKENSWTFEEGIFDQNNCANLRVEWLLGILKQNIN
jgi:glutathione synthase/RimK-type ligase-like ATP-grasp enzyme